MKQDEQIIEEFNSYRRNTSFYSDMVSIARAIGLVAMAIVAAARLIALAITRK